jgi:CheY-like chemotaxis protein
VFYIKVFNRRANQPRKSDKFVNSIYIYPEKPKMQIGLQEGENEIMSKILIVDDEPDIVSIVGQILGNAGHEVVGAGSGRAALEKLEAETPDLILLDIMMPELDGWQTLGMIRKKDGLENVPVSMLTAKPLTPETAARHDMEWLVDYIEKPFSKDSLIKKVNYNIIEDLDRISEKKRKLLSVVDEETATNYEISARLERLHKNIIATLKKGLSRADQPLEAADIHEAIASHRASIDLYGSQRESIEKNLDS